MKLTPSVKTFVVLYLLFLVAFLMIIYINYSGQQEQMLTHIQTSATAQTTTIKEALVNMMVTNERVDDSYLRKISSSGDIRNIGILFRLDSLHLAEDYLEDSSRTLRLAQREVNVWDAHKTFNLKVFETTAPEWYFIPADNKLQATKLENLTDDKPAVIRIGDELQALIPFVAEKKCTQCHDVQKGQVLGAAVLTIPLDSTAEMLERNALYSFSILLGTILISLLLHFLVLRKL
ncbi:MAG: hypothetical protein HYV29_12560 [Ignavibacteriales bacterium]|nr:hypothetical protein [Ignavibacteriales bacterium]